MLDLVGNCVPPSCPDPTVQTATGITVSAADLGWTENGTATAWEIEYGNAGFVLGTGTLLPAGTNPFNLSGLSSGTSYDWYVRADCGGLYSNWVGPHNFSTLVANDDCSGAVAVLCGSITSGTTVGAALDTEVDCPMPLTAPGVWYAFVGTGAMVSADVCTASYDTKLYVYTGTCGSLTCVDGNDDYCSTRSRVDWFAENGTTYYILVHGYSTNTGTFDLTVDCTDPVSATWIGGDGSYQDPNPQEDWFGADNWDVADVPGVGTDVTLPAGLTYYPTIDREARANNLSIGSDASGTATILDYGYLAMYGTGSVDLYFSGNDIDWHLVSSPITTAQAGVFMDMYLQSFDNNTYVYSEIIDETTPLDVMTGYAAYSTLGATNTVNFSGNINFGAEGQAINPGFDSYNWNLLGNPYPSAINWDAVTIPVNMTNEVHYIEAATGNDLSYVQGVGGTGSQIIPPMQGFFVSALGVDNLIFDDAVRTHGGGGIYKDSNPQLVVLEAAGENFTDQTWIHFNENAGEEHDGQYDAYKRISTSNPQLPQIYSTTPGGVMMSVNGMPEVQSIPVGFKTIESGVFTISAIETGEFTELYLEDLITGTVTNIYESDYSYTYTLGDQPNRFILHFSPLAIGDLDVSDINVFSYDKEVYVKVPENTNGEIIVYNMMGQEVVSTTITDVLNVITLENSAYYVVTVVSNESVVTKKVFVK